MRRRGSVLPKIAVTLTDDGALLVADRVGWKNVAFQLFLVVMIAVNIWVFRTEEVDDSRRYLSLVYAGGGVLALISAAGYYRLRKRIRGASLTVHPWPIRLGDEVKAELRVWPVAPASARVECVEVATSGRGKFETTKSTTLYSCDIAPSASFVIPDQLPPSFDVPGNKVVWQVSAMISAGDAEVPMTFELLVIPEVAA